jgi:polyhydroxybutyrate depolymerase
MWPTEVGPADDATLRRSSECGLTMARIVRFPALLLLAAALAGCDRAAQSTAAPTPTSTVVPGDTEHTVVVDNMPRTYRLHVPPGFSSAEPFPLVFAFHGLGEDAASISAETGMSDIADADGFLVVYPNGTVDPGPLSWNAGGCCGYAMEAGMDEAAFVRAILNDLQKTVAPDPKRIYAMGFSNGALLAYRLGCEMSETFAAIAPVAGLLSFSPCQPQEPVSVVHIHGSSDVSVPFNGGGINPSTGLPFPSVYGSIAAWERIDGCADSPQRAQSGIVAHTVFSNCRNGTAVELYVIVGLGHVWPPSSVLPASQIIWGFFAAHPKP